MKLNLIYYKCLLDAAVEKIVDCCEDFFQRENGRYILSLSASKQRLHSIVKNCIDDSIQCAVSKLEDQHDSMIVIGSCYPKDNLLLDFKDDKYFPRKLTSLIENRPSLKWLLSETDIDIDIDLMNELFIDVFNGYFNRETRKRCRAQQPKIIFASHSRLDCYMLFKTIKWAYGSSNCRNMWKDIFSSQQQNIVAINDLISKYVNNKSRMNKSASFKRCALEVKDYLDAALGIEE